MTQSEFALAVGTSQAAISAYEAGRRSPSGRTLERIVATELPSARLRRCSAEVREIFARFGIDDAVVFGSVARGTDTATSDVDFLFTPPERMGLITLGSLTSALERVLGVPVDAVPRRQLRPDVRREAEAEAVAF